MTKNNRVAEAQQIVQNFEELRADGPDTVLIKQKEVNFDLPTHLSSFAMIIGKEGNSDWSEGIGTGPYVKEDWQPGIQYLGRKYANFYRDDQGHFDEVEILNISDPVARMSGLLSNTLHAIGSPETKTAGASPTRRVLSWCRYRPRNISLAICALTWTRLPAQSFGAQ